MKFSLREYHHHKENFKFLNIETVVQQDNSNNLNQQEATNKHQLPVIQAHQVQAEQPRQKKCGPGTNKKAYLIVLIVLIIHGHENMLRRLVTNWTHFVLKNMKVRRMSSLSCSKMSLKKLVKKIKQNYLIT